MKQLSLDFSQKVRDKLARLPDRPGCYLMRDRSGAIIYVGKATSLRSRVSSYFRPSTFRRADPKLRGLVRSIDDLDFIVLRSPEEAALTESRLIKEYKPHYNVELKDDKRFLLIKLVRDTPFPRFAAVRLRKDDGARYWGPYASTPCARAAVEFVQKHIGVRPCSPRVPSEADHRHCLKDVVCFCSAPCIGKCSPERYAELVEEACAFLDGRRPALLEKLRQSMLEASAALRFERAAVLRDFYLLLLKATREHARVRKTPELLAAETAAGLRELADRLRLPAPPSLMECYDISNTFGSHSVASQVVSVDGVPTPSLYRSYRIKTVEGANDPASIAEVLRRRFERAIAENKPLPDLVLVDGGITQLRAARAVLDSLPLASPPALAGIAEKYEELWFDPTGRTPPLRFDSDSPALRVVQRLRDEAHRFALAFHRRRRARVIRESVLDEIPGVGPARKRDLLRHFGSLAALKKATLAEIAAAPRVGEALAREIHAALHPAP